MVEVLKVVPYDVDWPRAFRAERDRTNPLRTALD
jgi:hypothetical protein